jgi:hypothetical protein
VVIRPLRPASPGAQPFFDAPFARVHRGRLSVLYLRWYVEKAQAAPHGVGHGGVDSIGMVTPRR